LEVQVLSILYDFLIKYPESKPRRSCIFGNKTPIRIWGYGRSPISPDRPRL